MVKKLQKMSADKKSGPQLSSAVKESAQQIWLAGLGAFSKAQEEGSKVFETLVKEGLSIQRKTQAVAEEKISEATSKMSTMATDIQSKAGNQWDKLENIFEDRVAKALNKLGVPSAKELDALIARVDQLEKNLHKVNGKSAPAKPETKPAAKPVARKITKPAAKRTPPKNTSPVANTSGNPVASPAEKPAAAKRSAIRKAA
ncbi:poly(hydroxyalkanoate) granule-associated protein [Polaromonas sp. OV174]|uniref:phasin family protein n=1 Tax=Polaromonas sp. OV174 TaxID=1855300 RepID=UPI0008EE14D7|nr:phasin family protein [Polaromonas sp. OV174]SFC16986.1 poly(hydroxyalkanoate) granule-associated protein [Polaromonas sp. OV174]